MKKIVQFAVAASALAVMILSACSSSKNTVTGVANVSRGKFTGTWVINSVTYEGIVQQAVTNVFDQAPPAAFVNSKWQLTNSGNGIYTLADGTSQTIFWSVNNNTGSNQLFQFKKLYQGDKASKVTEGYQLIVAANDGNMMTLKSPVDLGGKTAYVVYMFSKTK